MKTGKIDQYYCNQKFTDLSVDLEQKTWTSCCSALVNPVDVKWLRANPGRLFNNSMLQQERQNMLNNQPAPSCERACYGPESKQILSRRIAMNGKEVSHTNIESTPDDLTLVLGSICNLTCSYCCKRHSTAWTRDIQEHGVYWDDPRFTLNNKDRILLNVSQNEVQESEMYSLMATEIKHYNNVQTVHVSGGEPFLYNNLPTFIGHIRAPDIRIYTGLGVNTARLATQLSKLPNRDQITIYVSGESTHQLYEFNRFGNTWDRFVRNVNLLKDLGFKVKFTTTISNTTVFGFANFLDYFAEYEMEHKFCIDPDCLSVNVLDDDSKEFLTAKLQRFECSITNDIIKAFEHPYTEDQKQKFSHYIKEFARRRGLDLDIYPQSMLKWIQGETNVV